MRITRQFYAAGVRARLIDLVNRDGTHSTDCRGKAAGTALNALNSRSASQHSRSLSNCAALKHAARHHLETAMNHLPHRNFNSTCPVAARGLRFKPERDSGCIAHWFELRYQSLSGVPLPGSFDGGGQDETLAALASCWHNPSRLYSGAVGHSLSRRSPAPATGAGTSRSKQSK